MSWPQIGQNDFFDNQGDSLSDFFYWGFGFDSLGSTSKSQRLALKLLD
jgi:hypothetical protein